MKIYTIIQGHTKWYKIMANWYSRYTNVIWCTEALNPLISGMQSRRTHSRDEEALRFITKKGIIPVLSPLVDPGYGNCNLQTISTSYGIAYAKEKHADFVVKIRSDVLITNFEKFLSLLDFNKINCLAYIYQTEHLSHYKDNVANYLKQIIENNQNVGEIDGSYITDFIMGGLVDDMQIMWYNIFDAKQRYVIPTEVKLLYAYLIRKKLTVTTKLEYLQQYFHFLIDEMKLNNIEIWSLKYGYNYTERLPYTQNIIEYHDDKIQ